jgi:hypothetical protein
MPSGMADFRGPGTPRTGPSLREISRKALATDFKIELKRPLWFEQRAKKDLTEIWRALGEAYMAKRSLTQDDLIGLMSWAEDGLDALGDRPASVTGTTTLWAENAGHLQPRDGREVSIGGRCHSWRGTVGVVLNL